MKVGVIADTHIPGRAKFIPPRVIRLFQDVDRILHAGDLVSESVGRELSALAPFIAVRGNVDFGQDLSHLPGELVLDLDGVKVGMLHDSGPREGRRKRMKQRFPACRVVIFGHSHQPLVEDEDGLMLLNPGSACDPRSAKYPTVAILEIDAEDVRAELIRL